MFRNGFTLARSFELTAQWCCILSAGPLHPVTMEDLLRVLEGGSGWFREVVGDLHGRLSDFIHKVVVHRRDEAVRMEGLASRRPSGPALQVVETGFSSSLSLFAV